MLPNIFTKPIVEQLIARINLLTPEHKPLRGKMSVDQMLAHCNVSYEYVYEPMKYKKSNFFMKLIMKAFVKKIVTSEKPYEHNGRTAPDMLIVDHKNFDAEKQRLIGFLLKTQELGAEHFEGLESQSFWKLTATEWNNLFYKHLDHHLTQFGV